MKLFFCSETIIFAQFSGLTLKTFLWVIFVSVLFFRDMVDTTALVPIPKTTSLEGNQVHRAGINIRKFGFLGSKCVSFCDNLSHKVHDGTKKEPARSGILRIRKKI